MYESFKTNKKLPSQRQTVTAFDHYNHLVRVGHCVGDCNWVYQSMKFDKIGIYR